METPRLFDYFGVFGLNEDLPKSQYMPTADKQSFASSKPYIDFNAISSLRLRITNEDEILKTKNSEYLVLHELACKNGERLWLEIVYGRINDRIRVGWNGRSVSNIELYYLPADERFIKVPVTENFDLIPLLVENSPVLAYSHTENDHHYYTGDYELTSIIGAKAMEGHKMVMTCTYADSSHSRPIVDITLVASNVQTNDKGEPKKIALIPEGYKYINYPFGRNRDSFLCFKTAADPLSLTFKAELLDRFPKEDYADDPLNQALYMFCFTEGIKLSNEQLSPSSFTFILATVGEHAKNHPRLYASCLIFYEPISQVLKNQLNLPADCPKLFVPKALCLTSHWPFIEQKREALKELYRLHLSMCQVPLERIICNLLQEIPLPDQGATMVMCNIGRQRLTFSRPPANDLPYLPEICLDCLFRCLRIPDIIAVWSWAMIERKILLISTSKALLSYVSLAIAMLIYPFKWQQVLISILPCSLKNYIETIFPYIIGVSPTMLTKDIEVPFDALRVDLDSGEVIAADILPVLPKKSAKILAQKLADAADDRKERDLFRENADDAFLYIMSEAKENRKFNSWQIRDAFLEFQTKLLKKYQRFFLMPSRAGERFSTLRQCFNTVSFLKHHSSSKSDNFLRRVTETSMFANFIENRYSSQEDNYSLSYFDEACRFRRSKSKRFFVKPHQPQDTLPTLYANDIGFEPGSIFHYDSFPRLNDKLFIEPRKVLNLVGNPRPRPSLSLKDSSLIKLTEKEWAKCLESTIYRVWFSVFSAHVLRYKSMAEELLGLAFNVMESMKKRAKPDESVYRKLIEVCGKCGLKAKAMSLFKIMKNQGIEPDACTHGIYVTAVACGEEGIEPESHMLNLSDLTADSICLRLNLNKVVIAAQDNCPSCGATLTEEEIMMGWEKSYSTYTTTCPVSDCKRKFVAKFTVMVASSDSEPARTLKIEFLSPPLILKELENLMFTYGEASLLTKDFCDKHKILFWNLYLYFSLMRLPYFFLDPNFKEECVKGIVRFYLEKPKTEKGARQVDPLWGLSVSDKISDKSSMSEASDHSYRSQNDYFDTKIAEIIKTNKLAADRSINSPNESLAKIFGEHIIAFRSENLSKGLKYAGRKSGNMSPRKVNCADFTNIKANEVA